MILAETTMMKKTTSLFRPFVGAIRYTSRQRCIGHRDSLLGIEWTRWGGEMSLKRSLTTNDSANRTTNEPSDSSITTNAFHILGIPQSFEIDAKELKQKYLALMNQHHPDHQQHQTSSDVEATATTASTITHAYEQLLNPHRRAVHLLEVLGKPLLEGESNHPNKHSKRDASSPVVDMEFLSQVMEIREQIDHTLNRENPEEEDGALLDAALKPLWHENNARIHETCHALQQAFQQGDLDQALRLTGHLQYWNRIDETIRENLSSLN